MIGVHICYTLSQSQQPKRSARKMQHVFRTSLRHSTAHHTSTRWRTPGCAIALAFGFAARSSGLVGVEVHRRIFNSSASPSLSSAPDRENDTTLLLDPRAALSPAAVQPSAGEEGRLFPLLSPGWFEPPEVSTLPFAPRSFPPPRHLVEVVQQRAENSNTSRALVFSCCALSSIPCTRGRGAGRIDVSLFRTILATFCIRVVYQSWPCCGTTKRPVGSSIHRQETHHTPYAYFAHGIPSL